MDERVMFEDKVPPHDAAIERGVLGAALVNDADAIEMVSHLKPSDFYIPTSRALFESIAEKISTGSIIDPMTIKNEDGIDPYYVIDCITNASLHAHVKNQMEELARMGKLRLVIERSVMLAAEAYTNPEEDILAKALDEMMEMSGTGVRKSARMLDLMDERILAAQNPEDFFSVDGFEGLHLFAGDFVVIGGRPGTGKTAYALQMGMDWSVEHRVMFYTYEMTEHQLADRVISSCSGLTVSEIEEGLTPAQVAKISDSLDAKDLLASTNMEVRMAAGMSNAELFADMHRFKARGGEVVIIDYLQLAADKSKLGLTHDTTMFSNKLRRVALDTGLLVIAVAQLNRGPTDREAVRMPLISDLRESGAIEQDATAICLLLAVPNPKYSRQGSEFIDKAVTVFMDFKKSYLDGGTDDPDDDKTFVVVDWAKVRQGKRRKWPFIFDGGKMTFTPVKRLKGVRMTEYKGRVLF